MQKIMDEIRFIALINKIKEMTKLYLFLAVIGCIVPYGIFINWLFKNGVDISLFWSNIVASPMSIFAWLDVLITALVLLIYLFIKRHFFEVGQRWVITITTCLIGPSCSLPLLLYYLEKQKQFTHQQL